MAPAERIAIVCPRFSEWGTVGGAETLLKHLGRRIAAAGRQVDFLTTCAEDHHSWANALAAGSFAWDGMTIHRFPVDEDRDVARFLEIQESISLGLEVSAEEELDWLGHSVNSRALCRHLEAEGDRYDRILLGPYLFGLIWQAAQIRPGKSLLVPCLHDEPFARVRAMRRLFEPVRGFLFNTLPEQRLAQRLFGIPEARCAVVGMGLDPFDADPDAFARRHGIHRPYVLFSGRREPLKGTPLLTDYVAAFRERTRADIALVFTGSGDIEAPSALWPHILDVGFVSEEVKREAMAGAVAFVHPSVNESLGIVLLESWMAGAPCMVSAFGEVLRWQCESSGGGLWFRTYPDFEQQLELLLQDPALRNRLGQAGRDYVLREYGWPAVDQRLFDAMDG
jgi:glycosyltransferase involved in cell wall biosynthesis